MYDHHLQKANLGAMKNFSSNNKKVDSIHIKEYFGHVFTGSESFNHGGYYFVESVNVYAAC